MPNEHRNPHTCRGNLDLRVNDLLGLGNHFPFFFGGAVFHEHIDMRDHVKRNLLWKNLRRAFLTRHIHAFGLVPQFLHRFFTATGNRLVGRHHNPFDRRAVMQRFQRHNHLCGRTIRVRDDVFLRVPVDIIGVHLWHNQRNLRVIPIKRRIIDNHTANFRRLWRVLLGCLGTHGKQRHIPTRKIKRIQISRLQRLLAERNFRTQRATRCKHCDLFNGELSFIQDVQHFTAHIASGANDDDSITQGFSPEIGGSTPRS